LNNDPTYNGKLCTVPACKLLRATFEADKIPVMTDTVTEMELLLLIRHVISDFSTKENMDLLLTGCSNPILNRSVVAVHKFLASYI